jgi:hypothetical protein
MVFGYFSFISTHFGILPQEKSGNPGCRCCCIWKLSPSQRLLMELVTETKVSNDNFWFPQGRDK